MNSVNLVFVSVLTMASIAGIVSARASVPLGVYAVVDKVVLEPNDAEPQRVQIWGTFARWNEKSDAGYRAPERGYLYYRCETARIVLCRNEWADLKSTAGTDRTVGFGSRDLETGRVRRTDDRAADPDAYPLQFGVVSMGSPRGKIFDQLRTLARGQ